MSLKKFNIPLGKINGIPIRSHILFWIVMAFIVGWVGFILLFLCCCSLLGHELGHAYAAKKVGAKPEEIVFLPFGAIVKIGELSIEKEAIVCLAGPLVSFFLAVIFTVLSLPLPGTIVLPPDWNTWQELCLYLAAFNWISTVNLLPIFPLDGGRTARSLLCRKFGFLLGTKITKFVSFFSFLAFGGLISFLNWNQTPQIQLVSIILIFFFFVIFLVGVLKKEI